MNSNAELNMIADLDLDPIKVKLMHKESGEGWTLEQATEVEFEYRRFLCLMKLYPNEQTAPRFDVDIFWHYHILDTMKYAADCEHIFGYFLHHFPYVGLGGEDDEAVHHRVGARMQELYEATFGEPFVRPAQSQAATAMTAFSINVAQNDSSYAAGSAAPAPTPTTAFSINVALINSPYAVRPVVQGQAISAKTAFSINVAQNESSYSESRALPVPAIRTAVAFSINVAQRDRFNLVRPSLAKAA